MKRVVFASLLGAVCAVPDSTSTIIYKPANPVLVQVRTTVPNSFEITAKKAGVTDATALFSDFGISMSGMNGEITNVNPSSGPASYFTFTVKIFDTTGPFILNNTLGIKPLDMIVWDEPDANSAMQCDTVLDVSQQIKCTIEPRNVYNQKIWSIASRFKMSADSIGSVPSSINWTSPLPAVGNSFTVLGNINSSNIFIVKNGRSTGEIQVAALDDPDGTSTIVCDSFPIPVTTSAGCKISAKKKGIAIVANASEFSMSGINAGGTYSSIEVEAVSPFKALGLGSVFSVKVTAGPFQQATSLGNTGVFNVAIGLNAPPAPLTIIVEPDETSTLACSSDQTAPGNTLRCNCTAKKIDTNVLSLAGVFQWTAKDSSGLDAGAFTLPLDKPTTSFGVALAVRQDLTTPNRIFIENGKTAKGVEAAAVATTTPDATSNLMCPTKTLAGKASMTCSITVRAGNLPVFAKGSAFTLTDSPVGGTFGDLSDFAAQTFTFQYTASATPGSVSLSDGISRDPFILTVTQPVAPTPAVTPPSILPRVPTPKPGPAGPTPEAPTEAEAGNSNTLGATIAVITGLLCLVVGYLLWRRFQKRSKVDEYMSSLQQENAGDYVAPGGR